MINTYEGNYIISTDDGQYESIDLKNFEKRDIERRMSEDNNLCATCINRYACTMLLGFSRKNRDFTNVVLYSSGCNCYNK